MERDSFAFAGETWGFKEGGDPKLNLSALLQKKIRFSQAVSSSKVTPIGRPQERKSWVDGTDY